MNFPENLKYTKDHEWVSVEGDIATIGITDFAQKELGEIVYVDITTIGDLVETNQPFGTIEAVKTVSDLLMPASGVVSEMNGDLDERPELVNEDPYGAGWIIKAKLDPNDNLNDLMDVDAYKKWIAKE